ncbi:glucocorticoid-induced transcript 1 protein-like isoform X2 [Xyrauchen texanus]|uniref:glucocorticoid-induced transcript 1 protein-like isoform X2 n=1 Tax=Xyrauchen texanus TaxID=154827 RepID=UPI00224258AC|nr:glucocorticoid-induced transcript 1 protein-like isoform X2 [Xyrauchen texanus]
MNTFSVLVLEFVYTVLMYAPNARTSAELSLSVPKILRDEVTGGDYFHFCSLKPTSSPSWSLSSSSSDAVDMKQSKPTIIPSETLFITAGRVRPANRQSTSLDNLPELYLTGQWPREVNQPQTSCMSDKATQTPGFWREDEGEVKLHKSSSSWGNADHLIELQRSLQGSRSIKEEEHVMFAQLNQTKPKLLSAASSNMVFSRPVICRIPSCSDCINEELENVFICDNWGREKDKALEVRDGGRAPVPPLHHTHNMEAQLTCSPCYCCSPTADSETDFRSGSPLPQLASSPKPNNSYMFKREPPEGCERVKVFEDIDTCRTRGFPIVSCPDRNKVNFSPSGSAFCPVKLLCSSLFPVDTTACSSSLDNQTSGQMSGPFTGATVQNSCSIRKCLLLS